MRVRFHAPEGWNNPVQDCEWPCVPRTGEFVEISTVDDNGIPLLKAFKVKSVHHMLHTVVPADVVIMLQEPTDRGDR